MHLRVVVPHQERISGGRVFNTELVRALRARGRPVEVCHIRGDWPWPSPHQRQRVSAALSASPGQIVVIDGLVGSACPDEVAAAVAAGVRVVVLVHLPLPAERGLAADQQAALAQTEARALHAATAVATTSEWAAADLQRRYQVVARVVEPGATPAPVAGGSDPPLLLMVAAFTPVKNHRSIAVALGLLPDLPWQAAFVGAHSDGHVLGEVRRRLGAARLGSRVCLPGELLGEPLDQVWDAADLLLVPSWTETYGLVVTEALARGIPGVVSRGTGAVEALAGRRRQEPLPGSTADPADPSEWGRILRGWLTTGGRRDRWRRRALERRTALRDWADTAVDLEHLVEGLR